MKNLSKNIYNIKGMFGNTVNSQHAVDPSMMSDGEGSDAHIHKIVDTSS